MSFAVALRKQIEAKRQRTAKERRLLVALDDDTPGPVRRKRLALAEEHAKSLIGFEPNEGIDWSRADWNAILAKIVDFITKLLALFA